LQPQAPPEDAVRRSAPPPLLPDRNLQGAPHPLLPGARRRLDAAPELERDLRGPGAARLRPSRRHSRAAGPPASPGRPPRRAVKHPPVRLVRQNDTCRLVPARRSETVLARIAEDDRHLKDLFELDDATNDRLLAENGLAPGIGSPELVFGVPY